jgi:hypothetical protein
MAEGEDVMAWKRQRTSQSVSVNADVDLDDFSEKQLLQALIDASWISEEEAEAIETRSSAKGAKAAIGTLEKAAALDDDELYEARTQLLRGNRSEALIHLERFLGRDWIGTLQ